MPHVVTPIDMEAGTAMRYHRPCGTILLAFSSTPNTKNVQAYADSGTTHPGSGKSSAARNGGLKNVVWNTSHTHVQNRPKPIDSRGCARISRRNERSMP